MGCPLPSHRIHSRGERAAGDREAISQPVSAGEASPARPQGQHHTTAGGAAGAAVRRKQARQAAPRLTAPRCTPPDSAAQELSLATPSPASDTPTSQEGSPTHAGKRSLIGTSVANRADSSAYGARSQPRYPASRSHTVRPEHIPENAKLHSGSKSTA